MQLTGTGEYFSEGEAMLHAINPAYRRKPAMKAYPGGFTLVEMLVTVAIVGVIGGLCATAGLSARARARATQCLANQGEISKAMLAHYTDHAEFPLDGPDCNLALQLEDYIPWSENLRSVALPEVWRCPNDRAESTANSYEPYYVRRQQPADGRYFVLGCPRHDDTDRSCVNLHGTSDMQLATAGAVDINGKTLTADAPLEQRTAQSGTMKFEDGSTATLSPDSADFGVSVVASFRNENGALYTVVRVTGKGDTDFQVTKGSRFEVVTPVAIIGVRGTTFTVYNEPAYTRVDLHTGKVVLWATPGQPVAFLSDTGKNGDLVIVADGSVASASTSSGLVLTPGDACEIGVPEEELDESKLLTLKAFKPAKWRIKNDNAFNVPFTWDNYPGSKSGSGIALSSNKNTWIYDAGNTIRVRYTLPDKGPQVLTGSAFSRYDRDDD